VAWSTSIELVDREFIDPSMNRGRHMARANLVRLARLVGWLAHALEQQLDKPMLRCRLTYTGRLPAAE